MYSSTPFTVMPSSLYSRVGWIVGISRRRYGQYILGRVARAQRINVFSVRHRHQQRLGPDSRTSVRRLRPGSRSPWSAALRACVSSPKLCDEPVLGSWVLRSAGPAYLPIKPMHMLREISHLPFYRSHFYLHSFIVPVSTTDELKLKLKAHL